MTAPWRVLAELDAPGGGNWQGTCRNAATGEMFIAHSRKRDDGDEDVVLYRFSKAGHFLDRMTLLRCSHVYGFGISDSNVVWLTWNDDNGNDVVTVQYRGGATIKGKSQTQQMHVFTDQPAWVSFSPSRAGLVVMESLGGQKRAFTKRLKADVLDNRDVPQGKTIIRDKPWLQGFSVVNDHVLLLFGAPEKRAVVERWDVLTGELTATLDITPTARMSTAGRRLSEYEVEGMDGRTFSYKINGDSSRRMLLVELDKSFTD